VSGVSLSATVPRLHTPSVPRLHTAATAEIGGRRWHYMVMDRAGEREFGWCGRDQTEAALGRAFATALVGLVYMHSCGVAHLDVKPANILVDRAHSATLIDFGLSLMQRESTRAAGTLPYIAPEICKRAVPHVRAYNTFKSDVWSLGISLFAAAAGFHPWALANVHEQRVATAASTMHRAARRTSALARRGSSSRRRSRTSWPPPSPAWSGRRRRRSSHPA